EQVLAGRAECRPHRWLWCPAQRLPAADSLDTGADRITRRPAEAQPQPVVDGMPEGRPRGILDVPRLDRLGKPEYPPLEITHHAVRFRQMLAHEQRHGRFPELQLAGEIQADERGRFPDGFLVLVHPADALKVEQVTGAGNRDV